MECKKLPKTANSLKWKCAETGDQSSGKIFYNQRKILACLSENKFEIAFMMWIYSPQNDKLKTKQIIRINLSL